ncbi:ABC transporter substrate-binding protein [Saccharopolyspora rhizosphaerae]|uniref:Putative aliphatic sulfonates-binding protein n=1 Tax=Saccharopolyspora rhizosphaerae TaxID=2492662 RepID=A0A3R8QD63_9PSEU|nr:ABC transporter substrate-binding protein [Saccharopolyspora rhizosphaerae]RRO18312.1 ABC transporter substrate-binding protein [Saccharopolyspora rhizosphaerae]
MFALPPVRRLLTVVTTLLVFVATLTACGSSEDEVVLRVGDQTGETQSRLRAAGLLDDLPYEIEWAQFPAAAHLHEALRADAVDIGSAADSPTVAAIAGGSPIKAVAAWNNGGKGTYVLVPADSPIRTLADLKGKRISPSTRGSVAHYLVLGALEKAGLDESDATLNYLAPTDASSAFSTGSIDAWATWGVYAARTRGQLGARVLTDGAGINSGLSVLSATNTSLTNPRKRRAIADFADRVDRSYQWAQLNPAAFDQWYSGFARQPLDVAAQIRQEQTAYRRIPLDDAFTDQLQRTFTTWTRAGVLHGGEDVEAHIDPTVATP